MAQQRIQKIKKNVKRGSDIEAPDTMVSSGRSARLVSQSTAQVAVIDTVLAENRRN